MSIIEVKRLNGVSPRSETQLCEYAEYVRVDLAVLTDGCEWNFYLPNEKRRKLDYDEEYVYQLNLMNEGLDECASRLLKYLAKEALVNGEGLKTLRREYGGESR